MVAIFEQQFRRHWFVVARSTQVQKTPVSVVAFGRPFALVRDPKLGVLAFEDRCPHRGVPLSLGTLSAEGLRCRYHGWTFGTDGYCRVIPGAVSTQLGNRSRVPMFPVRERDGLIWLSMEDSNPMPLRAMSLNPERRRFIGQLTWRSPILEAQENFLDALHTPCIHSGLVRRESRRAAVKVVLQTTDDGFVVEYFGQPRQTGWLFRLFESPRDSERAYFSGMSMAQIEYRYKSGWAAWISLYFTPETPTSTHVFTTLHLDGRWAPAFLVRMFVWPLLKRVGLQDQFILEQQEATRVQFPARRYVVADTDIVRPYLEAAWKEGEPNAMPDRREYTLML